MLIYDRATAVRGWLTTTSNRCSARVSSIKRTNMPTHGSDSITTPYSQWSCLLGYSRLTIRWFSGCNSYTQKWFEFIVFRQLMLLEESIYLDSFNWDPALIVSFADTSYSYLKPTSRCKSQSISCRNMTFMSVELAYIWRRWKWCSRLDNNVTWLGFEREKAQLEIVVLACNNGYTFLPVLSLLLITHSCQPTSLRTSYSTQFEASKKLSTRSTGLRYPLWVVCRSHWCYRADY